MTVSKSASRSRVQGGPSCLSRRRTSQIRALRSSDFVLPTPNANRRLRCPRSTPQALPAQEQHQHRAPSSYPPVTAAAVSVRRHGHLPWSRSWSERPGPWPLAQIMQPEGTHGATNGSPVLGIADHPGRDHVDAQTQRQRFEHDRIHRRGSVAVAGLLRRRQVATHHMRMVWDLLDCRARQHDGAGHGPARVEGGPARHSPSTGGDGRRRSAANGGTPRCAESCAAPPRSRSPRPR